MESGPCPANAGIPSRRFDSSGNLMYLYGSGRSVFRRFRPRFSGCIGHILSWPKRRSVKMGGIPVKSSRSRTQCCGMFGTCRRVAFIALAVLAISLIPVGEATAQTAGTAWAWGDNWSGQLGDGTTTKRQTPVQVVSLADCVAVGGGIQPFRSCEIRRHGLGLGLQRARPTRRWHDNRPSRARASVRSRRHGFLGRRGGCVSRVLSFPSREI